MKRKVEFVDIEGCLGADQNWFDKGMIRIGGCSAVYLRL